MNYGLLQIRFKNSLITYHNLTLYELYFNGGATIPQLISYTIVLRIIKHICHLNVKKNM